MRVSADARSLYRLKNGELINSDRASPQAVSEVLLILADTWRAP